MTEREIEEVKAALATGPVYVLYPGSGDARRAREAGLDLAPVEGTAFYEVVLRDGASGSGGYSS